MAREVPVKEGEQVHAGQTLPVEVAHRRWRIYDPVGSLLAEVARTSTKPLARFKVHNAVQAAQNRCEQPESGSTGAGLPDLRGA